MNERRKVHRVHGVVALWAAGLVLIAAGVAGCDSPPSTPAPPPVTGPSLPDDPNALILQVRITSGYPLGPEHTLGRPANYVVSRGGGVYAQGPVPEIYPGPLLPPLESATLSSAQFNLLLTAIGAARLSEYGREDFIPEPTDRLADGSITEVLYRDRAGDHRVFVEGLRAVQHTDERAIRLLQFLDTLDTIAFGAGLARHEPDRVQVWMGVSRPADPATGEPEFRTVRPWPLPDDPPAGNPGEFGTCRIYENPVATRLLTEFVTANQHTRWEADDVLYHLLPRGLFPPETGCEF